MVANAVPIAGPVQTSDTATRTKTGRLQILRCPFASELIQIGGAAKGPTTESAILEDEKHENQRNRYRSSGKAPDRQGI